MRIYRFRSVSMVAWEEMQDLAALDEFFNLYPDKLGCPQKGKGAGKGRTKTVAESTLSFIQFTPGTYCCSTR